MSTTRFKSFPTRAKAVNFLTALGIKKNDTHAFIVERASQGDKFWEVAVKSAITYADLTEPEEEETE